MVVTSRLADRAAATAARLPGAAGVAADARDETSVSRVVEQVWSRLGGLGMLVTNAGLGMITVNPDFMTAPQGFWRVPPAGFRASVCNHLTGYFLMAPEGTPRVLAGGAAARAAGPDSRGQTTH